MKYYLIALLLPVLLPTTAFAQSTNSTDSMTNILNTCTPYSQHTRTPYTDPNMPSFMNTGPITCGQALGIVKNLCDQSRNAAAGSPAACSNPKYTNWLTHDFPNYPADEWFGNNSP